MPAPASSFTLSVTLGNDSFSASGKPDLVQEAFEDFKALVTHGGSGAATSPRRKAPGAPKTRRRARRTDNDGPSGSLPHSDEMPVQLFLAGLKLKGNSKIGTAILVWAAKHTDTPRLTPLQIHELWEQTEFKPPSPASNTVRDLEPAVKKGWIKREGRGAGQTYSAPAFGLKEVAKWTADEE
jgi:hypothetical protein